MNSIDDLDFSKTYTYADYLLWKFEERVELIKGKIFKMSPAPSVNHQKITVNILRPLANFLFDKKCEVFVAPFDVRLIKSEKSDKQVKTVVQPDICVICDRAKIADNRSCLGAPDLVIEILSPGNNTKELKLKFDLYEEFGVKEYWIVQPDERTLLRHVLNNDGRFIVDARLLTLGDKVITPVLPGFELTLNDVFHNLL